MARLPPHIPQLKIVLLGDESVGKTSLLNKWLHSNFDSNASPTIGGAAQTRREQIQGETYAFQIWDTAGAEKFRALTPLYARDSKGAAVVFDMTRRRTFETLSSWVSFLRQQGDIPFVIFGNKEDLADKQEVTNEEATNFAFSVESQFFSTSAKTGQNVPLAFRQVQLEAVELYKRSGPGDNQAMVDLDPNAGKAEGGCC
jgi:small GTP-binding protein